MMFNYLLVLFIPALVSARIALTIKAGKTKSEAAVEYTGSNIEIISDIERRTFKIRDQELKIAVNKLFKSYPTDVFVKSPTPWNDVYHTYNWPQVQRVLIPVRSRILGIHTKPIIISTREFNNYSQVKAKYNAAISHSVQETVTTTYRTGGELTVGQEFSYNVEFVAGSIGGSTSLSFSKSYGNETSTSNSVTLGTSSSVESELSPGQSVVVSLTATRGTLDIEIDYEAHLTGLVFANYYHKYKDHHFWGIPVQYVLKAAKAPKVIKSTEKISIGFYTSASIDVRDQKTSHRMQHVPAGIINGRGAGTFPTINDGARGPRI